MSPECEFNNAASHGGKTKMIDNEAVQVTAAQSSPGFDEADCEKHGAGRESNPLPDLKRKLKSRHLQMIAIGTLPGDALASLRLR
jgi:amino acid transporter